MNDFKKHYCRVDEEVWSKDSEPSDKSEVIKLRKKIEPWLSALFQSEHLSLLLGSGLTTGICAVVDVNATGMDSDEFPDDWGRKIETWARKTAQTMRRGQPNIEDRLRVAIELLNGLAILEDDMANKVKEAIDEKLLNFLKSILKQENEFKKKVALDTNGEELTVMGLLVSFLLSFASRMSSRERLHIFTTNYDRFIEYGCDRAGIRLIDRFVGLLFPIFRASRLDVDMHYNPPGIRGEPRFLEGVVRFTKLHGSLDWYSNNREISRLGLPFGAGGNHPSIPKEPLNTVMIYPNPAKDIETSMYPYAELFRDFSAAVCRPNSTLITYGYGFGDNHVNRVIKDMMTIPSAHLAIISFDDANGRIPHFCQEIGNIVQITMLVGNHFGDFGTLVEYYLPKPAIDNITWRKAELLKRRGEDELDKHIEKQILPDNGENSI